MANTFQPIETISVNNDNVKIIEWRGITENTIDADIPPIELCEYSDRSVHIFGTFGGGTVSMSGRNSVNGAWQALVDPQGNAISVTSEKLEQILELTRYMRPTVSGGTSMDIDVVMVLKKR